MGNKLKYFFYSPKGISLNELVEALPGSSEAKWSELMDYLYRCHMANVINLKKGERYQLKPGSFYLSSTKVRDLMGKAKRPYYSDYLQTLDKLNIVKPENTSYMAGEYCKVYRFTKQQMDRGFNHIQLADKRLVNKTMKRIKKDAVEDAKHFEDVHHELRMMIHKVVIPDYESIITSIGRFRKSDDAQADKRRKEAYLLACKSINEGTYVHKISMSSSNRRLNSIVTQTMKAIRRGMRFSDDLNTPLVERDASNSQFWVFTILNNPKVLSYIWKHFPEHAELIVMTMNYLERQPRYKDFKRDALEGKIYNVLVETYNEEARRKYGWEVKHCDGLDKSPRLVLRNRDYIKTKVMKILFGEGSTAGTFKKTKGGKQYVESVPAYRKAFETAYPDVAWALTLFRKNMSSSTFACLMQSVEAFIWLEGIAALMVDQGFEDFLTVHDCLLIKDKPYVLEQFDHLCDHYFNEILKTPKPNIK